MSYTALARRYRSQSFDDVVAQEPIAQTLKNAIARDRLHHAYLFSGTRGVGKTSMARIFARALNAPDTVENCPRPDGVEYPPTDVQQRMADAIMRGEDMNVIEIDGASNRGVDDARKLIANAGLAPSGNARFKVYIIDEVHMLTKDAFNTLLKIMEEPPSHLKFILCTTEPHKVLPTIHSRCQRFDFRNIPTGRIVEHLRQVVQAESVEAEDAVLFQVARLGNGSMRDALSLLDRLMATGESPLTGQLLERMLGLPDRQHIFQLVAAFADSDPAAALNHADALLNRGIAQDQLLTVLIEHLRNLMLVAACGADSELVELDDDSRKQAAEQAGKFDTASLVHTIVLLENLQRSARGSASPRALLDAALVRVALSEKFADVATLLKQSGDSKKKSSNGGSRPRLTLPPAAPRPAPANQPPPRPAAPQSQPEQPAPDAPRLDQPPPADAVSAPRRRRVATQQQRDEAMNLPLVREIADTFGARLVDLRDRPRPDVPAEPPPQAEDDADEGETHD